VRGRRGLTSPHDVLKPIRSRPFRLPNVLGVRRPRRPRRARTRLCRARDDRRCQGWSSPRRVSAELARPSRQGPRRSVATRSSAEGRGTGIRWGDPRPLIVHRVRLARWPRVRRWGRPSSAVTIVSPLPRAKVADSSRESSFGIGMGVLLVCDFSGSFGHWIAGETTPRMKSTSSGRSAAASASRRPA
jgi:hypothetical protein